MSYHHMRAIQASNPDILFMDDAQTLSSVMQLSVLAPLAARGVPIVLCGTGELMDTVVRIWQRETFFDFARPSQPAVSQ